MIGKMLLMDWRAMKYYQIRCLLLPVFLFLIGFMSPILVLPTGMMCFMAFSVNPFAVEEKGVLNHLYLTLPVKRSEIVAGRFCLSLLIGGIGLLISIPIAFLVNRIGDSHFYLSMEQMLFVLAISCLIFSIANLSMFPVLFKLGYQKGKFVGFYLPAVVLSIGYALYMAFSTASQIDIVFTVSSFASENLMLINGGVMLLSLVLLLISYLLSKAIYEKRDF